MMLEYRNITKKFGNKEAVKELTLNFITELQVL